MAAYLIALSAVGGLVRGEFSGPVAGVYRGNCVAVGDQFRVTFDSRHSTERPMVINSRGEVYLNGSHQGSIDNFRMMWPVDGAWDGAVYYVEPDGTRPSLTLVNHQFAEWSNGACAASLWPLPLSYVEYPTGDANMDGLFNSGDIVTVFVAGEYEDGVPLNSVWETGDFNGDREFDSGDLVTAMTAGGYGAAATAVPEPGAIMLTLIGLLCLLHIMSRTSEQN